LLARSTSTFGGSLPATISVVVVERAPCASVTASVAVYVPGRVKVYVGLGWVSVASVPPPRRAIVHT